MRNLILVMLIIIAVSCNNEREVQDLNWHKTGYIDTINPCVFIINDTIQIVGSAERGGDYRYTLEIKGKKIGLRPSGAWQSTYNDRKDLIQSIQRRYKTYLKEEERRTGVFYSSNYADCE